MIVFTVLVVSSVCEQSTQNICPPFLGVSDRGYVLETGKGSQVLIVTFFECYTQPHLTNLMKFRALALFRSPKIFILSSTCSTESTVAFRGSHRCN